MIHWTLYACSVQPHTRTHTQTQWRGCSITLMCAIQSSLSPQRIVKCHAASAYAINCFLGQSVNQYWASAALTQHSVSPLRRYAGEVFWFPELPTKTREKKNIHLEMQLAPRSKKNWCVCVFSFREAHLSALSRCHVVLVCVCNCVFMCHADGSLVPDWFTQGEGINEVSGKEIN